MKEKTRLEQRIEDLSSHLHKDVLLFRGRQRVVEAPRPGARELVPVALLVAAAAVLGLARKNRNSLFLKLGALVLTRLLQVAGNRQQS